MDYKIDSKKKAKQLNLVFDCELNHIVSDMGSVTVEYKQDWFS